jgi:ADP-ribose pyrophosphatase YjhB (NUDIX family)
VVVTPCGFDSLSGHQSINYRKGSGHLLNFCSHCGAPVTSKIPEGDHLLRFVCTGCGMIHYKNPLLVLGCVPHWQGKILLCRRAIEPRRGFWTVPAGFMENGETMQHAAARECYEEALATVEVGSLLAVVNVTHAGQVHVMFRAQLTKPQFAPGPESLEVGLYEEADIPWTDLAFPSGEFTLRKYFADRAAGREDHHFTELSRRLKS